MPRFPVTLGLVAAVLLTAAMRALAEPAPGLTAMWGYAADSQPAEARAMLRQLPRVDGRTRELAGLVLDLAKPPISKTDWARIEPQLARLAAGSDQIAAQALYLRARMYQIQLAPPDYARAGQLYRELARRWPGSHWAQLGFVKLGLVELYALPEPADARQRLAKAGALLTQLTEPDLRRDLELQIGQAALFYNLPYDEVLPHLIAADQIGGMLGITPADLTVQIGELSLRAGQPAQAKRYFERFLRDYPTDTRCYTVRQRLRAADQALAGKAAP